MSYPTLYIIAYNLSILSKNTKQLNNFLSDLPPKNKKNTKSNNLQKINFNIDFESEEDDIDEPESQTSDNCNQQKKKSENLINDWTIVNKNKNLIC